MKTRFLLVLVFLTCFFSTNHAQNRIIVNPSFETGSIVPHASVQYPASQAAAVPQIDGWYSTHPTYSGSDFPIEHWASGFNSVNSSQGGYHVELNVSQPSRLYQIVYLVNGETINFLYHHRNRSGANEEVEFNIYNQAGNTKIQVLSSHLSTNTTSWDAVSGSAVFTGTTGIYTIGFEAIQPSTGGSGNFLDEVTIGLSGLTEFNHSTITVNEGNTLYIPRFLVNGQVSSVSSVNITATSSDANLGVDYNFTPGAINIPIGGYSIADSIAIPFSIIDNGFSQGNRTVTLTIASVSGALTALDANGDGFKQTLTITIVDNDPHPGGVTGENLWLKANQGVSNSGSNLTGWVDQTGINTFSVTGTPQVVSNEINFNSGVDFQNTSGKTVLPTHHLTGNTSIDYIEGYSVYKYNTTNQTGAVVGGTVIGPNYGKAIFAADGDLKTYVGNGANSGYQSYPNPDLATKYSINNLNISTTTPNATGRLNGADQTMVDGNDFNTLSLIPIIGGTENNGSTFGWYPLNGKLVEAIFYPTTLSATERIKIESYLALKYGISLDQSVSNYLNSSGTAIWNNTTYWNDVFGLGKDSVSSLIVTQSNSINTGSGNGVGQSGKGNIVISNPTDLNNLEFLMLGHDNGALTEQTTDLPTSYAGSKRIGREWKIKRTGNVGAFDLSFDVNGLGITGTQLSDFIMLVDNDGNGDFTNGVVNQIVPISKTGSVLSFENLNLADNAVITFVTNKGTGGVIVGTKQATQGTGSYRNLINWITIDNGSLAPGDVVSTTFNSHGIDVNVVIDQIQISDAAQSLVTYHPGAWGGDRMDDFYNINGTGASNTLNNGIATSGFGATVQFKLHAYAEINGQPANLAFVFGNAEDDATGEYSRGTTNGSQWQLLEKGVFNTTSNRSVTLTYGGNQNSSEIVCSNNIALLFTKKDLTSSSNELQIDVEFHSGGKTAIAFGLLTSTEAGDAPSSYGSPVHLTNPVVTGGGSPAPATQTVYYLDNPEMGGTVIDAAIVSIPAPMRLGLSD